MSEKVVDLGCGSKKEAGALGVDIFPYPGVDIVANLDEVPWPLEDSKFDRITSTHILEHVADVVAFLSEVHRIAKPGGLLQIVTPHFSSINSWADPTHLRHLSTNWHELFLPGGYLVERSGEFELVYSKAKFGKSLRSLIPKSMIKMFGQEKWEKHYAFVYPASDIESVLRVVK